MEAATDDVNSGVAGRAGEHFGEEPFVGEQGGLRAENVYEIVVTLDAAKGGSVRPAPLSGKISGDEDLLFAVCPGQTFSLILADGEKLKIFTVVVFRGSDRPDRHDCLRETSRRHFRQPLAVIIFIARTNTTRIPRTLRTPRGESTGSSHRRKVCTRFHNIWNHCHCPPRGQLFSVPAHLHFICFQRTWLRQSAGMPMGAKGIAG